MRKHHGRRHGVMVAAGVLAGLALATACAGKGKGSRNPEECMASCERDQCAYDPNAVDNEDYLECLDACTGKCSG